MKKYTVLFVLALCLVFSQLAFGLGPKFGVGGNLAFPQGDWKDLTNSVGFGGTAQALMPFGENMAIGAQAGYISFGGQSVEENIPGFGSAKAEYTIYAIPILAQGRYYLGLPGGPRPFLGAVAGVHILSIKYTATITVFGITQSQDFTNSDTQFSFGPMAGVEVGAIDLAAFYMLVTDANYVGARIGFNFGGIE